MVRLAGINCNYEPQTNPLVTEYIFFDRITVIYNESPDTIKFPKGGRFGSMARYGLKAGYFLATTEYNLVVASTVYRSVTPLLWQSATLVQMRGRLPGQPIRRDGDR